MNDEDTFEKLSKLVGHTELQTVGDFKQEFTEQSMQPRFLVVHVQKYPNLLKRFQEGTVQPTKLRSQFSRLCQIKKKTVDRNEILDLDFLAHIAYNKESRSVEVITRSEGPNPESNTPRENPVPPDPNDISSNAYDEDTEDNTVMGANDNKELCLWYMVFFQSVKCQVSSMVSLA